MTAKTPAAGPETASPSASLPKSLLTHVPSAKALAKALRDAEKAIGALAVDLRAIDGTTAVEAARAFVVLHRLDSMLDSLKKDYGALHERYKTAVIPEVFEREGVPFVPLDEGYRVGVSGKLYASIKSDCKDDAFKWLRANKLGDLIVETVNASTLSAVARDLRDTENRDLPDDLFNTADRYTTSVTKTKAVSKRVK